jgi:hypothetical protein
MTNRLPSDTRPLALAALAALERLVALLALLTLSVAIVASPAAKAAAQPGPPTAASASNAFTVEVTADALVLTLARVERADVEVVRDARDVLFKFAKAAPPFDAADLQARAAGWIDGVNVGHDAVLLRLAASVEAQVQIDDPTRLTLRFTRMARPAPQAALPQAASASGERRLELLRGRLLLQDQQLSEARELFETLRMKSPDSAAPVAGLAAVETQMGRWRSGLVLYRQAQTLGDGDPSLAAAIESIEQAQSSGARLEAEHRRSSGGESAAPTTLNVLGAEGSVRWNEAWKFGADLDSAAIDTSAVQRANGAIQPFSGSRERAALSAQHDGMDGTVHVASLFAGHGGAGLGLSRRQVDERGATTFSLEARRDSWDLVEALVERALRDRVSVARSQAFGYSLSGRIEIGANRYTLPQLSTVARSTTLAGELRWNKLGNIAGLSATYLIDAEYASSVEQRTNAAGAAFSPLPLLDREVHLAQLGYERTIGHSDSGGVFNLRGRLAAGADRYGRSGSVAGFVLSWSSGAWLAQLQASQVRNLGRARGTTDSVAVDLSLAF